MCGYSGIHGSRGVQQPYDFPCLTAIVPFPHLTLPFVPLPQDRQTAPLGTRKVRDDRQRALLLCPLLSHWNATDGQRRPRVLHVVRRGRNTIEEESEREIEHDGSSPSLIVTV